MAFFEDERGDDEDRTEEPTQRRLDQALEQGNVPQSPELATAAQALAGAVALSLLGGAAWAGLRESLRGTLGRELSLAAGRAGTAAGASALARDVALATGRAVLPIVAVIALTSVAATLLQRRPYFSLERISPDAGRLDPLSNLGRAFQLKGATGLVVTVVKVALVLVVLRATLASVLPSLSSLGGAGLAANLAATGGVATGLLLEASLALVAAGALDFFFVHRAWKKSLRMSREEIKREAREEEGDPHLKARIRALQRQKRSKKKMLEATKTADAVVTNPTHLAIALKYDKTVMAAPRVVAKGADHLAAEIREVARQEGIALVEDKPLARTLYRTVEVGGEVPPKLYQAVAEVLAFVYRLKRRTA